MVPYRPDVVTTSSPTASEAWSAWTCCARLRWLNMMKTSSSEREEQDEQIAEAGAGEHE